MPNIGGGGGRFPLSRRALRFPISAPAELFDPIMRLTERGTVTVINAVGCFICAADTLEANTIVRLRIEHNEAFETQGTGRACPQRGHGAGVPRHRAVSKKYTRGMDHNSRTDMTPYKFNRRAMSVRHVLHR